MSEHTKERQIAEQYLTEMLEADQAGDYEGFIRRFDSADLEGFSEDIFRKDVALMREELGAYRERTLLGSLNGFSSESRPRCLRFVWRAFYEKNEALIIVGIHEKDGVWYVNESVVSK